MRRKMIFSSGRQFLGQKHLHLQGGHWTTSGSTGSPWFQSSGAWTACRGSPRRLGAIRSMHGGVPHKGQGIDFGNAVFVRGADC